MKDEKQELERLWLLYTKRRSENLDADGWFFQECIEEPLQDVVNRLEPLIIDEFFEYNVTCIRAYRDLKLATNVYELKKEHDPRVYRLIYDPSMDIEDGLHHDVPGSDETFVCYCGEVYDLIHRLSEENVIEF